jgi:hypothetical protein
LWDGFVLLIRLDWVLERFDFRLFGIDLWVRFHLVVGAVLVDVGDGCLSGRDAFAAA